MPKATNPAQKASFPRKFLFPTKVKYFYRKGVAF